MFSHHNLSLRNFAEIMKSTMLNMVKEANKKLQMTTGNKTLDIESQNFLMELEDFKWCPQIGELTPEALIYILDQFERRVSKPETILNRKVDEKGYSRETGFTPLGEAVLGSIILGVRAFTEENIWNEDFLPCLQNVSLSQISAVTFWHQNAVEHKIMPVNGVERAGTLLSYVDKKYIPVLENAIPPETTAHPLFFKHFSNQLQKREIKNPVNAKAKDTDSALPECLPTIIETIRSKVFEDTYESETINSIPKVDSQYMSDMQNDVNYRYEKLMKVSKSPIFTRNKTVDQVTHDDSKNDCFPCNLF